MTKSDRRGGRCSRVRHGLLLLATCSVLAVAPAAAAFKHVEVGDPAPDFTLRSLSGDEVHLRDQEGPKALAVVFWATWSPRSQALLDDLEKLYRERMDKGLAVLAVNVDHEHLVGEDRQAVEQMSSGWSFPTLIDDGLATYYAYGVVATPSVALLDDRGTVRFAQASYSTAAHEDMREAVDALLGIVDEAKAQVVAQKREYVPPKKATLHFQKAKVLVKRGMAKKAVQDLRAAAKMDSQWADPRILLARIYLSEYPADAKRLAEAEDGLQEAVSAQPRHVNAHALLADVRVARKSYEAALVAADAALALSPGFTPALLAKARSLRAMARLPEARSTLQEALESDPRNPSIYGELGEVLANGGEWKDASEAFRRAVELALTAGVGEG